MIFSPTTIAGAWVVNIEPHVDDRGSFARAFCAREFEAHDIEFQVAQANLAHTNQAGVVRGLHYQEPPHEDQKLVRCVAGAVFDVIIDMRQHSPTWRSVFSMRLDATQRQALFIPGGVAHGYQALEDATTFLYMTDQFYSPGIERGVRFDDPELGVSWPLPPHSVAQRDRYWPLLGTSPPKQD